ncbi:MAG TPA: hypothetical protein VK400_03610 [Pyrinomonadaceae bacterium]|nr:hypothetical protein [Pyrinomonadaceae bacterium]
MRLYRLIEAKLLAALCSPDSVCCRAWYDERVSGDDSTCLKS